jgi:GNAT superfamily N-acetyltransferase
MEFRNLKDRDVENAYSILCWRIEYLLSKGIKQYEHPYPPKDIFLDRQRNNYNYALYDDSTLAIIVSLMPNYKPGGWISELKIENFIWVTSLFSSKEYKGKNLGYFILDEIGTFAKTKGYNSLILDCYLGDGFLVKYYNQKGYKEIARKEVEYPNRIFQAVLMEKEL